MSWNESMLDASFRGITFDVINTRDTFARDVAQYEYPFVDGGDVEDLGRKPRNLRMTALFWGDDYESRLQTFLVELDKKGSGELIHPVFGSMPKMQLIECQVSHEAENVDYCVVELVFIEAATNVPFFGQEYPTAQADAIFNKVQSALDKEQTLLDNALAPLRTSQRLMAKAKALAATSLNMITIFRSDITGFVSSTTDFINYPGAYMADLQSALSLTSSNSASSVRNNVGTYATPQVANIIVADWNEGRNQLATVAELPAALASGERTAPLPMPIIITEGDIAELVVLTYLQMSLQLALDAADLLGDESVNAALSPADIELVANDTRQALQNAIDKHRELYEATTQAVSASTTDVGITWQPVVNELKDIALSVQQLAAAIITTRPPLIQRKVESVSNLHLLAHLWYGDYARAVELVRLNPQIRNPNALQPGDMLYAYAR